MGCNRDCFFEYAGNLPGLRDRRRRQATRDSGISTRDKGDYGFKGECWIISSRTSSTGKMTRSWRHIALNSNVSNDRDALPEGRFVMCRYALRPGADRDERCGWKEQEQMRCKRMAALPLFPLLFLPPRPCAGDKCLQLSDAKRVGGSRGIRSDSGRGVPGGTSQ